MQQAMFIDMQLKYLLVDAQRAAHLHMQIDCTLDVQRCGAKHVILALLGAKAPTKIQEVTLMRPIHGNL